MTMTEKQFNYNIAEFKRNSIADPVYLAEHLFRVRNNRGEVAPYIMTEPHKKLMRTGILGDKSALWRIIDKGRQLGFSVYQSIESLMIAQAMPLTFQYYVAAKEAQAKSWLKKVERAAIDSRTWFDGSRIIDIDTKKSSLLQKVINHLPKEAGKEIEESYIVGLAASPGGIQGETAINVILDEFAWMIQRKDQQREIYEAVKYFISQGGQLTVQSTPFVSSDFFWESYVNAEDRMFTPFYCPTITNWKDLDLNMDLRKQNCIIPYPWVNIDLLEKARREDLTFFKQRNLGVPADVMNRFLDPEVLKMQIKSQKELVGNVGRIYGMTVDVAQERDLTSILVAEKCYLSNNEEIIRERFLAESQEDYVKQAELVTKIAAKYPLQFIGIDTTGGHGRGVRDILKYKVGVPLRDLEYATKIEIPGMNEKIKLPTYMGDLFKAALINGKYELIEHQQALQHCLNVESTKTPNGGIRYSGKKNGRDDHFWTKAMMSYCFFGKQQIGSFKTIKSSSYIQPQKNNYAKIRATKFSKTRGILTF